MATKPSCVAADATVATNKKAAAASKHTKHRRTQLHNKQQQQQQQQRTPHVVYCRLPGCTNCADGLETEVLYLDA
jgi:hypothetical protein